MSRRTTSQSEAAVAASPLDPDDVVISSNVQRGYGISLGVSHDGGLTWSRSTLGTGHRFGLACCDSSISWDASGNLFLAWLGYADEPFPTVVTVLLSVDGGDSWSRLRRIDPPDLERADAVPLQLRGAETAGRDEEEERGGFIDQPTITTGPHALWATWNNDGQMQVAGARVRGLGDVADFKQIRDIPDAFNCTFGDIAVGPGGAVAQVCQRDVRRRKPVTSVLRFSVDADGLRAGAVRTRARGRSDERVPLRADPTAAVSDGRCGSGSGLAAAGPRSRPTDLVVHRRTTGSERRHQRLGEALRRCRRHVGTPDRRHHRRAEPVPAPARRRSRDWASGGRLARRAAWIRGRAPSTPMASRTPTRCTRSPSATMPATRGPRPRW